MTRKVTLPFDQAMKLGAGDVLIVRGIARLVLEGPRDNPPPIVKIKGKNPAIYFHFAIHRRSWTNRAHTCYLWNDLKFVAEVPRRFMSPKVLAGLERLKLESIGFNPDREIAREVRGAKAFIERKRENPHPWDDPEDLKLSRGIRFLAVCQKLAKAKRGRK